MLDALDNPRTDFFYRHYYDANALNRARGRFAQRIELAQPAADCATKRGKPHLLEVEPVLDAGRDPDALADDTACGSRNSSSDDRSANRSQANGRTLEEGDRSRPGPRRNPDRDRGDKNLPEHAAIGFLRRLRRGGRQVTERIDGVVGFEAVGAVRAAADPGGQDQALPLDQRTVRAHPVRFGQLVPQVGVAPQRRCNALQRVARLHRVEPARAGISGSCQSIIPNYISHMTAAVWQAFYLALIPIPPTRSRRSLD